MPVLVVHHHDRRAVAGAEALELEQREHARRVGLADLDPRASPTGLGDALGADQRARQRAAHLQHVLADRLLVEHHVVGRDVLDFRRRHVENPATCRMPFAVR